MNLVQELLKKPGYLKCGPNKIADTFGVSFRVAKNALIEARKTNKNVTYIPTLESEEKVISAEYQEFLEWKKFKSSREILTSNKRILPKPFLTDNKDNVLVIGDIHEPFCLKDYLQFCRNKQEEFNCGTVVFIGDLIDAHYSSYHEAELDTYGANQEFDLAKEKIQEWYKVFPKAYVCLGNHDRIVSRKAKTAQISDRWIKSFSEALDTPNWEYVMEIVINNVCYNHGEGGEAARRMTTQLISQVQGHLHAKFYIQYGVGARHKVFGAQVGCGIDRNSFAFAYGKNGPKPVIGCLVVLKKGTLPILLPMDL